MPLCCIYADRVLKLIGTAAASAYFPGLQVLMELVTTGCEAEVGSSSPRFPADVEIKPPPPTPTPTPSPPPLVSGSQGLSNVCLFLSLEWSEYSFVCFSYCPNSTHACTSISALPVHSTVLFPKLP